MTIADNAAVASAVFAAASAGFAGWQIRVTRIDARRRAAFDQIRLVGKQVTDYNDVARTADPDDVLAFYRRQRSELTPSARAYMNLLHELDLTAYGIHSELLDRKTALGHLKTILRSEVVSLTFLRELQGCCGDEHVYDDLSRVLVDVSADRRAASRPSSPPARY